MALLRTKLIRFIIVSVVLSLCPPQWTFGQSSESTPKWTEELEKKKWSEAIQNLKARLDFDDSNTLTPGQEFEVNLKLHSPEPQSAHHPKLLAGRFVFVITPINFPHDRTATIESKSFSGGGGIKYDGKHGLKYKIKTPERPGEYQIFACVHSSMIDIKYFMMTAKMQADARLWWHGVLATPSKRLIVAESTDQAKQPVASDQKKYPIVTIHRFNQIPKQFESRIEDGSQLGWHKELFLHVNGVNVRFGTATSRRSKVPAPVELDPKQKYTFVIQRTEHFGHLKFALVSIAKNGVKIYKPDAPNLR